MYVPVSIRVVIADDHPLSREGVRQFLQMEDQIDVVGEAADGEELLALLERTPADVALIDTRMPKLSGLEAAREIRDRFPQIRVLMLSAFDDRDVVIGALDAGARGYILKDRDAHQLIEAVLAVVDGQVIVDPKVVVHGA
jgi:two-component system, NarL family, response regulator DegU